MRSTQSHSTVSRLSGVTATLLAALVSTQTAFAEPNACLNQHAAAQRELKAGRPKSASEQFMACGSDDSCPEAVRNDCMSRYTSTEKLVPSIVLSVVDQQGNDVTGVQVFNGEQLLSQDLDGRAVALEPGKYSLRFTLPWGEHATSDVVLREGEKNRVVTVKVERPGLEGADAAAAGAGASASLSSSELSKEKGPLPTGFWVATGVSAAALASFGTFAFLGRQKHEDLADCSPNCPSSMQSDYDAMKRNYLIADISLGVAVASAGVATWLFFDRSPSTGPGEQPPATARRARPLTISSARLSLVPSTGGGSLMLSGTSF